MAQPRFVEIRFVKTRFVKTRFVKTINAHLNKTVKRC